LGSLRVFPDSGRPYGINPRRIVFDLPNKARGKYGGGAMLSVAYGQLIRVDPVLARQQLLKCHQEQAGGNISQTARLCGISRFTVRKYVQRYQAEGLAGLKNRSCRPHHCPQQTPDHIEDLVLLIFQQTNYGFRRIARQLKAHGVKLCYRTVGKILKRHGQVRPRKKLSIRRTGRRYYNPLDFKPFEFLQIDIKEVIDGDTLPTEVYVHLREMAKQGVPLYQFTPLDVRTRLRFLAYGQTKSFNNGWAFIIVVVLWLRAFGIKHRIILQSDWGDEFGGTQEKKLTTMNHLLAHLDAELTRIQKGRPEQNGHVERSHKTDDEEFYIPYGLGIEDINTLFLTAYSWLRYYNTKRPHGGDNLDGKTPLEYTKELMPHLNSNIALFPPLILDNLSSHAQWQGGKQVCEHYISCRRVHPLILPLIARCSFFRPLIFSAPSLLRRRRRTSRR